jgi:hypothetical protein
MPQSSSCGDIFILHTFAAGGRFEVGADPSPSHGTMAAGRAANLSRAASLACGGATLPAQFRVKVVSLAFHHARKS